ncbi:MAG: hypothetical protein LBB45_06280 [Methanobrevibacter sp.]|jgi:hypothetical protein|nr:hypothetical protein [Candidatus Methanovirga basalitermitum]
MIGSCIGAVSVKSYTYHWNLEKRKTYTIMSDLPRPIFFKTIGILQEI